MKSVSYEKIAKASLILNLVLAVTIGVSSSNHNTAVKRLERTLNSVSTEVAVSNAKLKEMATLTKAKVAVIKTEKIASQQKMLAQIDLLNFKRSQSEDKLLKCQSENKKIIDLFVDSRLNSK